VSARIVCANAQHGIGPSSVIDRFSAWSAASGSGAHVAGCGQQEEGVMSQAGVGMVVEKLLTDQNLRIGLALDPLETVAELMLQGFDLTGEEIYLFCRTDPRMWFLGEMVTGEPGRPEPRRSAFA